MKTYIIHVSDAFEREKYMLNTLKGKGLDIEFILDGDKKKLTPLIINTYFSGELLPVSAGTSCAYKHVLAYQKIVSGSDDVAMILEDDIRFYNNDNKLNELMLEIKNRKLENFIISLEDSTLKYIPKSKRQKGRMIYRANFGRCAGAYFIDKKGAQSLLDCLAEKKMDRPVDWFHNFCQENNKIGIYWSQPALAIQASIDGSMPSLIDNKKVGAARRIFFRLQKSYKKLIANLR